MYGSRLKQRRLRDASLKTDKMALKIDFGDGFICKLFERIYRKEMMLQFSIGTAFF